jgi:ribosomal protein L19
MIQKDMLSRKVIGYELKDEILTSPKQIKVGANEVVYVCYCSVETIKGFILKIESGTDVTTYHNKNTVQQRISKGFAFHSSQITSHWSNIKVTPRGTKHYYLRFIRISILKYQTNEKS